MNIDVDYLGLKLSSPVIAGSCGLMMDVDYLKRLEDAGVGAVVLKSIFEEQIIYDIKRNTHIVAPVENYGESYRYVADHAAQDSLEKYFEFVHHAREAVNVPIIGSINCYSHENWINYAQKFIDAGCDALELNMDILPYDTSLSWDDVDRVFGDIIRTIRKITAAPLAIKVGRYFTDMAKFMQLLSWMGVQGITMFNKPLSLDVDIDGESLTEASMKTSAGDLHELLHWVLILKNKMRCDISATTGVYCAEDMIKLLLAGAGTVQVVSALYEHGPECVRSMNAGLREWMERKGYQQISDFRGRLALKESDPASMMMRTLLMEHMADID